MIKDSLKKLLKVLVSIRVPLRGIKKSPWKNKLKYDERLKRVPMMIRKNNVAMKESNDNIDHKNVVII